MLVLSENELGLVAGLGMIEYRGEVKAGHVTQ